MQGSIDARLGVARARPDGGGVVYDDVGPTGLQPLVDSSIEVGRRCALAWISAVWRCGRTGAAIGHRWLGRLRHRHDVRRDASTFSRPGSFASVRHAADRIVLEVSDFGGTKL